MLENILNRQLVVVVVFFSSPQADVGQGRRECDGQGTTTPKMESREGTVSKHRNSFSVLQKPGKEETSLNEV